MAEDTAFCPGARAYASEKSWMYGVMKADCEKVYEQFADTKPAPSPLSGDAD